MRTGVFAVGVAMFAGCGPSTVDHHDDATAKLTVDPPTSELLIQDGVAATEDFTATLTYPDGETKDVTDEVRFSVDEGYGLFDGHTLKIGTGGKTQVLATLSEKNATAEVIARVKDVRVDPSLPAGAAGWFSNPEDPSRAPTVVYPAEGVIMPRNLGDFEVHWTDPRNDVFEISLKTDFTDVRVIVPGTAGMAPMGKWTAFLASEWLAAVAFEQTVTYQVRGVDSKNPTSVGSAAPRLVRLTTEQMLGGLYYWAATADNNGPYGIFRHDMSKPGQPAEQYYTTAQTGDRCVACHVLSRDGKHMAITYDGGNGAATLVDVATKAPQAESQAWNFGTFTPDASKFFGVHDGTLTILDSSTQAVLGTMPASGKVTHPDLSADGTRLVYVSKATTGSDWDFGGGKIFTRTYDQATNSFGPELQLVSDTNNNYYPSFSPDGKWILFNRASSGTAYNNANASLWVVKADGSAPPTQLLGANLQSGLTNSWGRWAPFQQTIGANAEPMFWITVSSKRDFGVRLTGVGRPQLWMTPFFPARADQQLDPSADAFRLPFQNIDSNNHIAQWTEQVISTL